MKNDKHVEEGVYDLEYHEGRKTKLALKYRLARRADEALRVIARATDYEHPWRILDLGTADGLMLSHMLNTLNTDFTVGIDLSLGLLNAIEDNRIKPILANGLHLPLDEASFDLVVATAVIEHASDPLQMLVECLRVLMPGGLCVVTTPDPFWERFASRIGHLPDEGHNETMNLRRLHDYLESAGFEVVDAYKFMMSPWGFPAEFIVERLMRFVGLGFLLVNQIILARKPTA